VTVTFWVGVGFAAAAVVATFLTLKSDDLRLEAVPPEPLVAEAD
jgi:hypothetical protein